MLIMCYKHLYIFYKRRNNMAERLTKKINKTTANFYKAYDECVRLFRGGGGENETLY